MKETGLAAPKTLVLGVGNLLCTDEGVGIHLAQRLMKSSLARDVDIIDGGTGGFELLLHCSGRRKIVLLDAVRTDDPPGTVLRIPSEAIALESSLPLSVHQKGLTELLLLLKSLDPPPEVTIIGIVPKDVTTPSTDLTEPVRMALGDAVGLIQNECEVAHE